MRHFKLSDYPVEDLSISQIIPYANNPRIHGDRQVDMIEASILKFGMVNPVLVTSNHEIIAGHGRLAAAKKMGMQTIPAIALSHLTEAEVKPKRWIPANPIRRFPITATGTWDNWFVSHGSRLISSQRSWTEHSPLI